LGIEEEKARELEKLLGSHLQPGESIVARSHSDGSIKVQDLEDTETVSSLRESHPVLFGKLSTVDERISSATGCASMAIFALVALSICISLQTGLITSFIVDLDLRDQIEEFAHPFTYVVVCVLFAFLWNMYDDARERRVYSRWRHSVLGAIARERLDIYETITVAEGDSSLSSLLKFIKRDPDPNSYDPARVDPELF